MIRQASKRKERKKEKQKRKTETTHQFSISRFKTWRGKSNFSLRLARCLFSFAVDTLELLWNYINSQNEFSSRAHTNTIEPRMIHKQASNSSLSPTRASRTISAIKHRWYYFASFLFSHSSRLCTFFFHFSWGRRKASLDYIRKKKLKCTRWIVVWWSSVKHLVCCIA